MTANAMYHTVCGGGQMVTCPQHGYHYCERCEQCPRCAGDAVGSAPVSLNGAQPDGEPRNLYAERLAWRRADQDALRKLAAEDRPPVRKPEVLTLRERLARPRPPVQWRIADWQPAGSRVMLSAAFKGGKTTVIANLVRSLADGDPFLGAHDVTAVDGTVVVVDFEMSANQLDQWYADQDIANDDRVVVIPLRGSAAAFDIIDPGIRSQWAGMLKSRECCYLVVDCLRPILDALNLDEHHEAGRLLTALDALLTEAGIPDACVVHHMGHVAERSRGDSRIRDWPDVEWRLVREDDEPSSPRYVSAYGRDVEISESRLGYDPATRRLSIGRGSRKDAKARAALVDILKVLTATGEKLSGRQIEDRREMIDHGQRAIRAGVKLGIKEGSIGTEPGPKRSILHFSASVRRSASEPSDALPFESASVRQCVTSDAHALTHADHSDEEVSASDQSDAHPSLGYDKEVADDVFARLRAGGGAAT